MAQHIPCYSREARKQEWNKESYHKVVSNRQALFKLLKPFDAHIMSGHEHYNENYILAGNLYEHCHAPLSTLFWCAPWAMDGTPGGYAVYEIEDGKIKDWHYKSVGFPKDYQMNVYPVGVSREHPEAVVANVWNYDSSWKVELLEDGVITAEMTRPESLGGCGKERKIVCLSLSRMRLDRASFLCRAAESSSRHHCPCNRRSRYRIHR